MKNKSTISFIILLIIWQISSLGFSQIYLPSPLKVFETFLQMVLDGSIFVNIGASLFRVFSGFFLALISSFMLAFLFFYKKSLRSYFSGLLSFFKNIPPLGLIPLLIIWLGIGETSKIAMVFMACFFPLFLNIEKGFLNVDSDLIEMAQVFSYKDREIFKSIILPASLKDIFTGARIALGYAFRSIIAAEMLAASTGLGYLLNFSRLMSRTDKVMVALIVIGLIGLFSDWLFVKISKRFLKGDLKNDLS